MWHVDSGFRVHGSGFTVQGAGFRVQGSGFRVQGSGFRVQGSELSSPTSVSVQAMRWRARATESGKSSIYQSAAVTVLYATKCGRDCLMYAKVQP